MKDKIIDCFFIGHNEMDFGEYEKEIQKMGIHSGAYRDLSLNFIQYNNKPYSASDIFNLFYLSDNGIGSTDVRKPLNLDETFSAAIAYLGTYINRRGFSFDYVNSFREHKEELTSKLAGENLRTIAIITTLYVSVFPILEIMDFIKTYNRTARVIIGGPFISTQVRTMDPMSLEYLFKSIGTDIYVNSSQGEATLVKILQALKNNTPLDQISNIYYKTNGRYVSTPILVEKNDLSENMVNWELFSDRLGEFVSLRTSISCPFSCAFCGFPEHAGPYQTANIEAVEEELNGLARVKPVKSINFIDDTFNVPPKRFKEILKVIQKNNYGFKWNSHYRCQFADRESVELMKQSGCEGVFLGIESGNDDILKNMNKATTVEKYLAGIKLLKEYGILTYGSFIVGFPGETERTVQDTLHFIKESGLDFFRAQLWYCEPVTPIWRKREEYKISGSHFQWTHNTMDSQQACDLIEEIFLSVENPIWTPQYNFECDGMFKLIHRGFTLDEVKNFIISFNNAVKETLVEPTRKEISYDAVVKLKKACKPDESNDELMSSQGAKIDPTAVDFDF
jgi:anaerobic magnesium-protoporphyrin IX monomethyl ester cyclase